MAGRRGPGHRQDHLAGRFPKKSSGRRREQGGQFRRRVAQDRPGDPVAAPAGVRHERGQAAQVRAFQALIVDAADELPVVRSSPRNSKTMSRRAVGAARAVLGPHGGLQGAEADPGRAADVVGQRAPPAAAASALPWALTPRQAEPVPAISARPGRPDSPPVRPATVSLSTTTCACGPSSAISRAMSAISSAVAVRGDAAHAEEHCERRPFCREVAQRHADGVTQVLPDLLPRVVVSVGRPGIADAENAPVRSATSARVAVPPLSMPR